MELARLAVADGVDNGVTALRGDKHVLEHFDAVIAEEVVGGITGRGQPTAARRAAGIEDRQNGLDLGAADAVGRQPVAGMAGAGRIDFAAVGGDAVEDSLVQSCEKSCVGAASARS